VKTLRSLALDIRAVYPFLKAILLISSFCLGGVLGLHWWKGIPLAVLTRDPAAVKGLPFYTGILSNIGIVLWSAATALCLFSAWLVTARRTASPLGRFLYASGLFTMFLLWDDLLQLHEYVLPRLGISEHLVYGAYASMALLYLFGFGRIILATEYPLLGLALIFFGLSVTVDVFYPPSAHQYLWEDGAKFIGIVTWLLYFTRVSGGALRTPALEAHTTRR